MNGWQSARRAILAMLGQVQPSWPNEDALHTLHTLHTLYTLRTLRTIGASVKAAQSGGRQRLRYAA